MIIELSGGSPFEIKLEDGYYNYTQLQTTLQQSLINIDISFSVNYSDVNRKFSFVHLTRIFSFRFDLPNSYDCGKDNYKTDVYAQHSNWGLGYILGFDKKKYDSSANATNNTIVSPNPSDLEDNKNIYIELEKYNKCDEIKPFLYYNYNNANSGIVNSAFAKIPIYPFQDNKGLVNDGYFENISYYQPPIDKIAKLKLKFRYHNGMLVDFHNFNVSLSLEINQIRNEMNNYEVRTPYKVQTH
jgi:hypothetical protein